MCKRNQRERANAARMTLLVFLGVILCYCLVVYYALFRSDSIANLLIIIPCLLTPTVYGFVLLRLLMRKFEGLWKDVGDLLRGRIFD
jgi:ABC-type molybdate transport system permease subunit